MKRNISVYIVGILALLLLSVNMITLQKYKTLKKYCQEQIADKSITGQKEMALWVNSQIAFSVNGMKMPNILLKEYNGVTIPLCCIETSDMLYLKIRKRKELWRIGN